MGLNMLCAMHFTNIIIVPLVSVKLREEQKL